MNQPKHRYHPLAFFAIPAQYWIVLSAPLWQLFLDTTAAARLGVLRREGVLLAVFVGYRLLLWRAKQWQICQTTDGGAYLRLTQGLLLQKTTILPLAQLGSVHYSAPLPLRLLGGAMLILSPKSAAHKAGKGQIFLLIRHCDVPLLRRACLPTD